MLEVGKWVYLFAAAAAGATAGLTPPGGVVCSFILYVFFKIRTFILLVSSFILILQLPM